MLEALRQSIAYYRPDDIVLFGYSGGGVMAVLLGAIEPRVNHIVTVAGPIDHASWSKAMKVPLLSASLHPFNFIDQLRQLPQLHLRGDRDAVVPPIALKAYLTELGLNTPTRQMDIPGFDHICCWVEKWPELLAVVETELKILGPRQRISSRLQNQRGRVDAIAQPSRLWSVRKDMAQMRPAAGTQRLGARPHQQAAIFFGRDGVSADRLPVAGPARTGIELGIGGKQRSVTADAMIRPGRFRSVIFPGERALGPRALGDVELQLGQTPAQLVGIGLARSFFAGSHGGNRHEHSPNYAVRHSPNYAVRHAAQYAARHAAQYATRHAGPYEQSVSP